MRKRPFPFPKDGSIRIICDTDCSNEADDQYAVAHLLMPPRFDVRALIATHYGKDKDPDSEACSYRELHRVAELMELHGQVNILHGAADPLTDAETPQPSEGARFIVEEALRDDARPLFVCCMGAVTNLASAILMEPRICDKLTAVWIGGGSYPAGSFEYNLCGDLNAARAIFRAPVELWQVPKNVYIQMKVSFFQLLNHVYPCGALGRYLVENTMRTADKILKEMDDPSTGLGSRYLTMSRAAAASSFSGELWVLGDSPCVGLMMNHTLGRFHEEIAPADFTPDGRYLFADGSLRRIRVYDDIDNHFVVNDLFEKLWFHFGPTQTCAEGGTRC